MQSRNKITGTTRRAFRPLARAFLLLCIASQSFAAPLHLMGPADLVASQASEAECPAHSDAVAEAGNPESCECSGGVCCKARIDRQPALAATHTESRPADTRSVLPAAPAVFIKSLRLIFGVQSRAPPVTSIV